MLERSEFSAHDWGDAADFVVKIPVATAAGFL